MEVGRGSAQRDPCQEVDMLERRWKKCFNKYVDYFLSCHKIFICTLCVHFLFGNRYIYICVRLCNNISKYAYKDWNTIGECFLNLKIKFIKLKNASNIFNLLKINH